MRHFLLIFLSHFLLQNAKGQDSCSFKYLFIGHAYGSQDTTVPQWKSIIDNAGLIKYTSPTFYTFLGDICRDSTDKTAIELQENLISKISDGCNTKFIRGNHDSYNTWYKYATPSCCITNDLYFYNIAHQLNLNKASTLNSYLNHQIYTIDTENPTLNLDSLIKSAVKNSFSNNIVFLSHRLIWTYSNPRYKHLVQLTNSPKMHELPRMVDFDFLNAQKDKKFYFFAGDLGVNIPLFYDNVGNVTMYAVGCGGTPKDAALLAEFKRDTIIISLIHLGTANYNIEDYTLEKINQMPVPVETISPQQGFKGYQWLVFLGIFAVMALAAYMVIKPHE